MIVADGQDHRVLVAGAGVAGLECVLALRAFAEERVSIQVLSPDDEFTYRPMSVAEPFGAGEAQRLSLAKLLSRAGATHIRDALAAVEAAARRVRTAGGDTIDYDALVVACGGRPGPALPGALVFGGAGDRPLIEGVLDDLCARRVRRVVFLVPSGATWPLPAYELALMTASHLAAGGIEGAELTLLTPESAPLALFGRVASASVAELLDLRGIRVVAGAHAVAVEKGEVRATTGLRLPADHVVTLQGLTGPRICGLPADADGFVPVTEQGAVRGLHGVYAAGDAVSFPIKQGGIATQQADAVAQAIAARAGADLKPQPFRPVLRGLLLTGAVPRYLRHEPTSGRGETSESATEPLWWPPSKIAGRFLAPFLAELTGHEPPERPTVPGAVWVDEEV
jgi:sulfide:quinone oxidoreductase